MPNNDLQGRTIAFLCATEGTEQIELTEPWKAVEQAGGRPRLVSTESGRIQAFNHHAGATWVDEEVMICENGPNVLVSSRRPDDLKAFSQAAVEAFTR